MAEDFHAIFGLGHSELTLSPIDTAGVALGAAQELHAQLQAREQELAELRAAQAGLLAAQAELLRRLEALEQVPVVE